ncbi:hypothetical protein, partial [Streptomyces violaceorubidus]
MIEWQLPRYGRGPYDEVPPVLERVLRSPSLDEEAWRELWHLLATEGLTVSAASFAALPYLRSCCLFVLERCASNGSPDRVVAGLWAHTNRAS